MAAVSTWLKHLAVLLLLAVFLEAALPEGTTQKYVRLTLGLVIVLSMLNPLRALFGSGWDIGRFEAVLSGPLTASGALANVSSAGAAYRADLAAGLQANVAGSLGISLDAVQVVTTGGENGSLPAVTGVRASIKPGPPGGARSDALEAKYALAAAVGLPASRVTVWYPGGFV